MSEDVRATVLAVRVGTTATEPGAVGAASYWCKPGASLAEVEAALRVAGFEPRDRFLDAVNDGGEATLRCEGFEPRVSDAMDDDKPGCS